jgi:hypothetical protein
VIVSTPTGRPRSARSDPEQAPVHLIEPADIDFEPLHVSSDDRQIDLAGALDLGEISHPAQQPIGDAGRARERRASSSAPAFSQRMPSKRALRKMIFRDSIG